MTLREASIKYGFPEDELRELVRSGLIRRITKQNVDEDDIKRYYDDFWKTYITKGEMDNHMKLSSTKLSHLSKNEIIRRAKNGLYFREDFFSYIESHEKDKYDKLRIKSQEARK